jgi:uncharacterized protein (UPF0332 family)
MIEEGTRQRIERYLLRAHRVLRTGHLALEDGDYITAVNRAYYAIFYAANTLLATKGLERRWRIVTRETTMSWRFWITRWPNVI